jgi:hypothetical protein
VIGSWVVRSGSWVVNWSGFVVDWSRLVSGNRSWLVSRYNRCWVVWGRFVNRFRWVVRSGSWVVRSRLGWVIRSDLTFVFHFSNIPIIMVSGISDNLGTTIRKGDTIFTCNNTVSILVFLFGKISTRVFVFNTIFIGEGSWGQFFNWVGMVRGRFVHRRVVGSWGRGVVRSRSGVVRSRMIRGWVIGHSHSHDRSQQHFAQHFFFR